MSVSYSQSTSQAPTRSLRGETDAFLRATFEQAPGPRRRILWWDAGGHLKDLLKEVCRDRDIAFLTKSHPLAFREWVADQGDTPEGEPERVVWYFQGAPAGRDWFRDVQEMGAVIEKGIEDIVAQLYDVPVWKVRPWGSEGTSVTEDIAAIFNTELRGPSRPTLDELQMQLLTGDNSKPAEYILRAGWDGLPSTPNVVDKIRGLLTAEGVPDLQDAHSPKAIVEAVRRWAVAGWLHESGVGLEALPYHSASDLKYGLRRLKEVLGSAEGSTFLPQFQKAYWPEVVDALDAPWEMAGPCPVDGALETRLWTDWLQAFDNEQYEQCCNRATQRATAFQEATGQSQAEVGKYGSPWTRAWQQAAALADLAHRYATWDNRDVPVHELYADEEEGSWHIDDAVRRIIVSGTPEAALPEGHPATDALYAHRSKLVKGRYLTYLKRLADKMETTLATGSLLDDTLASSTTFWNDNDEKLAAGNDGLLFYIDALRLDLARALKRRLEERTEQPTVDISLTITESRRLSVLPSETKFGMAAVLPMQSSPFEMKLHEGKLEAARGQVLDTTRRKKLLEDDGWAVTDNADDERAWSQGRVAHTITELDEYAEKELPNIEDLLAERVEKLADRIFEKLNKGRWSRAYVITDHGFVLLPENTDFAPLTPPEGDVARRRVAGANVADSQHGILLHREEQNDLSYLHDPVRILVQPQERFSKRGVSDKRYYHGGALPQECIISFLEIEVT